MTPSTHAGALGGHYALAGFIYQFLGVVATKLHPLSVQGPTGGGDWDALLRAVASAKLLHEAYGQDAAVTGIEPNDPQRADWLIQFKFSSRPTVAALTASELKAVGTSFSKSASSMTAPGKVRYALVTNRPLAPNARSLIAAAKTGEYHKMLDKASQNKGLRQILERLCRFEFSLVNWHELIRAHCQQLGLTADEMGKGINGVIGVLAQRAASPGSPEITIGELDYALAGFAQPNIITPAKLKPQLEREKEEFRTTLGVPSQPVRRRVVERIGAAAVAPIVFVHGAGGNGKTVAACEAVDALAIGTHPPPYVLYIYARSARVAGLPTALRRWRGAPASLASESEAIAMERLEHARGDTPPPALVVVLDGADELAEAGHDALGGAHDLVAFVTALHRDRSGLPRAILIVTGRDKGDLEWLHPGGSMSLGPAQVAEIGVFEFDDEELLEAATKAPAILDRLVNSLSPSGRTSLPTLASLGPTTTYGPVDPTVLQILKKPCMWRHILDLEPEQQHLALSGDPGALSALCTGFVTWFSDKVARRHRGILAAEARGIVAAVAKATAQDPSWLMYSDHWLGAARASGFADRDSKLVFHDAESTGLIRFGEGGRWVWAMRLVVNCLAREEVRHG